ncbi:Mitochondrial escape protein 2 [Mycena venus]|uniref:Mitochondrial escape protein 2 n=1 Tax=Mycena venus TaxID=2733690 RepID=A0A8H6YUI4_9AGAR|nr:Mitochondrial escape protein 2 [Mycena venus]
MLRHLHRPLRHFPTSPFLRRYSDEPTRIKRYLFVDAFPGVWDIRNHIAVLREKSTLEALRLRLSKIKTHSFTVVDVQPHRKDGGAFVAFEFTASDPEDALKAITAEIKEEAKNGGLPSWRPDGWGSDFWLVKGTPWVEDMRRFPSNFVNVVFEGPDIREERLYELFRPYGKIVEIMKPVPVPPGDLRSATVAFRQVRSAAVARNIIHGLEVWAPGASSPTRLHLTYIHPMDPHKVRAPSNTRGLFFPSQSSSWGSLTYAIFDKIRCLVVGAKMGHWFVVREFKLYQYIRTKAIELGIFTPRPEAPPQEEVWQERTQAEAALRAYMTDWPSTITFVHGPQGSGKSGLDLLHNVLKDSGRKVLTIDCRFLQTATSDGQLLKGLAKQTGYWPFFPFLSSVHHLIDLASVGLIGQKANLSSTLTEQVRDMLEVVRTALKSVNASHRRNEIRQIQYEMLLEESERIHAARSERIRRGTWHDGRLDCVAGNGVMSELGIGDELMEDADAVAFPYVEQEKEWEMRREAQETKKRQIRKAQLEAVKSLPIVVIKNFAARGSNREEIYDVLSEWAASLVENQLALVVVISNNRENAKRLVKALPSKPLNSIALYDADTASALAFVKRALKDAEINLDAGDLLPVERLGGRVTDLGSLIHKVRNGATVEEAVEDIIYREVSEVRKKAFGDDAEDAKHLPWSREQVWSLFKLLSKKSELPYHEVLLEFPFKGDEASLRSIEHAELISVGTHNGRPSTIRPGKPVFRAVFERLVNDPIFQATQDIAFNEKLIAWEDSTVKACEQELLSLKEIGREYEHWWGGKTASSARSRYLLSKMHTSTMKIEALERQNSELKMVLAKGG